MSNILACVSGLEDIKWDDNHRTQSIDKLTLLFNSLMSGSVRNVASAAVPAVT